MASRGSYGACMLMVASVATISAKAATIAIPTALQAANRASGYVLCNADHRRLIHGFCSFRESDPECCEESRYGHVIAVS
jgi:hypothetical protein